MKKRVLSIALVLSMVAAVVPIMAGAETGTQYESDHDLYYEVNKDNTAVTITDCKTSAWIVTIPSEIENLPVTSIADNAFQDCSKLYRITIPDSVTSIGKRAFLRCKSLTDLIIGENNPTYTVIDGVLYNKTSMELVEYLGGKKDTSYSVPDGIVSIGESAFSDCNALDITIPSSVTTIGRGAFSSCSALTNIDVDDENPNYTSIDGVLFNKSATELIQYPHGKTNTAYSIPDGVTAIGDCAFFGCRNLTSVAVSDNVTTIGRQAFSYCFGLKSISIPKSVTKIWNSVFYSCNSLRDVYYDGTYEQWEEIDIGLNNDELRYVTKHYVEVTPPPTIEPTASPTATPTVEPTLTASPTASPTPTPTASPTASPTPTPTASPTASPTITPTVELTPTVTSTPAPTASPTAKPIYYGSSSYSKTKPKPSAMPKAAVPTSTPAITEVIPTGTPEADSVVSTPKTDINPFTDIKETDWFFDVVRNMASAGFMSGVSKSEFAPFDNVTRGMFATILYRIESEPKTEFDCTFEDMEDSAYYSDAVKWANEKKIIIGYSDKVFAPNDNITREQMAAIVYRYAKLKGYDVSVNGELNYFDRALISDYAKTDVIWNVNNGIMLGNDNKFNPAANATRAEAAAVLDRLLKKFE